MLPQYTGKYSSIGNLVSLPWYLQTAISPIDWKYSPDTLDNFPVIERKIFPYILEQILTIYLTIFSRYTGYSNMGTMLVLICFLQFMPQLFTLAPKLIFPRFYQCFHKDRDLWCERLHLYLPESKKVFCFWRGKCNWIMSIYSKLKGCVVDSGGSKKVHLSAMFASLIANSLPTTAFIF